MADFLGQHKSVDNENRVINLFMEFSICLFNIVICKYHQGLK